MYRIAEREMPHENGQQGASWANDSRRLERGQWLARWLESVRMRGAGCLRGSSARAGSGPDLSSEFVLQRTEVAVFIA
jgi:hypothetical protein